MVVKTEVHIYYFFYSYKSELIIKQKNALQFAANV